MGFGLVLGEDGEKIKSREGDTIKLRELLNEARDRALELSKKKLIAAG
jgi:arginyl-tRNA synthetase